MKSTIQICDLKPEAVHWLEDQAKRQGITIEALIKHLIYRNCEMDDSERLFSETPNHDLDHLAGTWSEEEANDFSESIKDFSKIDPDI